MATYYHVVRVNDKGEYRSAVVDGQACLRYSIGERTVGPGGMPVLVFSKLWAAEDFAAPRHVILAGTAGNPRHQGQVCHWLLGIRGFRRFWNQKALPAELDPAPEATYAADWFKPERVVQYGAL